jgi:hypothetical protein
VARALAINVPIKLLITLTAFSLGSEGANQGAPQLLGAAAQMAINLAIKVVIKVQIV